MSRFAKAHRRHRPPHPSGPSLCAGLHDQSRTQKSAESTIPMAEHPAPLRTKTHVCAEGANFPVWAEQPGVPVNSWRFHGSPIRLIPSVAAPAPGSRTACRSSRSAVPVAHPSETAGSHATPRRPARQVSSGHLGRVAFPRRLNGRGEWQPGVLDSNNSTGVGNDWARKRGETLASHACHFKARPVLPRSDRAVMFRASSSPTCS